MVMESWLSLPLFLLVEVWGKVESGAVRCYLSFRLATRSPLEPSGFNAAPS